MTSELRKSERLVLKTALVALDAWRAYHKARRVVLRDSSAWGGAGLDKAYTLGEKAGRAHRRAVEAYRKAL